MTRRRVVDTSRLWTGGLLAGVVAAGVAIVGLLVVRGIMDIPVLVERDGKLADASTWWYAAAAFLAAMVATGLLHVLLLQAPQPYRFFSWIVGLAGAVAVLAPYATDATLGSKVAASVINLVIGLSIGSIVGGLGRSSAQVLDEPDPQFPSGTAPYRPRF
jgi:tetrahydromethanopterin S-methyltransferase subunit C